MEPLELTYLLKIDPISFTRSARKHRIGRARVLAVLAVNPLVEITAGGRHRARILAVGPDWTGRQLELVAVIEQGHVVVIHAMDARPKLVRLYAEGIHDGQEP